MLAKWEVLQRRIYPVQVQHSGTSLPAYASLLGDARACSYEALPNSCGPLDCISLCHDWQCLDIQQYTEWLLFEFYPVECVP